MLRTQTEEIYDVGIDYITATTTAKQSDTSLDSFGRYLVDEETKSGAKARPWKWSGYYGRTSGAATYGRRPDTAIVRLSGHTAKENWEQVVHLSTNVSRLDLQVTVWSNRQPSERLKRHVTELKRVAHGGGRPPNFKFICAPSGVETIMVGSRASDIYLRAYDKAAESGLPEWLGCVRYEAELKRFIAKARAEQLSMCEFPERAIAATVDKMFRARKFRNDWAPQTAVIIADDLPGYSRSLLANHSAAGRSTMWLRNCVKPTVDRLVQAGKLDDVLQALGLTEHVFIRTGPPNEIAMGEWKGGVH